MFLKLGRNENKKLEINTITCEETQLKSFILRTS